MKVRAGDTTIELNIFVYLPGEKIAELFGLDDQELCNEIAELILTKIRSGEIHIDKNEGQPLVPQKHGDRLN